MKQRPTGVTVLAVVAAVVGVLVLLGAGAWWGASDHPVWLPNIHAERLFALVLLVIGICELVLACGAWMLRRWSWTFGVVLQVILIVLSMLQLGRSDSVRHILTIVIAGITLWYLARPKVRAAFGQPWPAAAQEAARSAASIVTKETGPFPAADSLSSRRFEPTPLSERGKLARIPGLCSR
jgi:hypothetical protein